MKKSAIIMISALAGVVFAVAVFVIPVVKTGLSQKSAPETYLTGAQSPAGTYQLAAYRTEPGATVDFSVRVYLIAADQKKLIYDAYHEHEAVITWKSDAVVSINGKILDLSQGETYNWRTQSRKKWGEAFSISITGKAHAFSDAKTALPRTGRTK